MHPLPRTPGRRRHLVLPLLAAALLAGCTRAADKPATAEPEANQGGSLRLVLAAEPVNGEAPLAVRFEAELIGEIEDPAAFGCPTLAWTLDARDEGEVVIAQPAGCSPGIVPRNFTLDHIYSAARTYETSVRFIARDVPPSNLVQIVVRGPTATPAPRVAFPGPTIVIATPAGTRVAQADGTRPPGGEGAEAGPTVAEGAGTAGTGSTAVPTAAVAPGATIAAGETVVPGATLGPGATLPPGTTTAAGTTSAPVTPFRPGPTAPVIPTQVALAPPGTSPEPTSIVARPTGMLVPITPGATRRPAGAATTGPGSMTSVPGIPAATPAPVFPAPAFTPAAMTTQPPTSPGGPGILPPVERTSPAPPVEPAFPLPRTTAAVPAPSGSRPATQRVLPADLYYVSALDRSLWRLPASGERPAAVTPPDLAVDAYDVASSGIIAFSSGGGIYLSSPGMNAPSKLIEPAHTPIWSRNGRQLAYGAPGGVYAYDIVSRQHTQLTDRGEPLAWSRDATWLLVGLSGGRIAVVSAETGTRNDLPFEGVSEAGWLPDRDVIWMAGDGLRLLALGEEWVQTTLLPADVPTSNVFVRPDDTLLVIADTGVGPALHGVSLTSDDLTVRRFGPPIPPGSPDNAAWAPDGRHMALAGAGGVALLDPFTGAEVPLIALPAARPEWVLGR
jgi:hypothetical protein